VLRGFATIWNQQTGEPHIYDHSVAEHEVEEVLAAAVEDRPARQSSRMAVGQTEAGRYLRLVYVPDAEPDSAFAYELGPKALKALKRRRRRKQ